MKKTFIIAAATALVVMSCQKKTETVTETTEVMPTETVDTTAEVTEATPSAPGDLTTLKYVSKDGKTNFTGVFDAVNGTAVVTNDTTGEVFNLKQEVSASGVSYKDDKGNSVTLHQKEFYLEKDGKTVVEATEVEEVK